jgi:hypothetical protein
MLEKNVGLLGRNKKTQDKPELLTIEMLDFLWTFWTRPLFRDQTFHHPRNLSSEYGNFRRAKTKPLLCKMSEIIA